MHVRKIIGEAIACVFLLIVLGLVAYASPAYNAHLQSEHATQAASVAN